MTNGKSVSKNDPTRITRRGLAMGATLAAASALAATPATALARRRPSPSPEERAEIEDLFSAYLWAYDCSDEEAFAELFSRDALVVGKGTHYQGREKILGWFRYLIEMREREGDDIWMHEAGQFRFFRSGGSWIVYAYATHFNGNSAKAMRGVRSLGYFACECREEKDGWKFHRFSISPWDRKQLPWKKPLPWAEP